jgi:multidrug efflux pump subunit AcrA (membrane-fusion protein)
MSLGNLSAMQVTAPFAEADAAKVKPNQTASFTFDAIPNLTLTGHVVSVAAAATTISNVTDYYVTLALDNIDQRLKFGMTANASVVVSQASNVLMVPNSAITHIGTAAYVTVLGSDGKRTRIPIQTGTVGDNTTEIASGLVQGEKVVLPQLTTPSSTGTTGAGRGLGGGGVLGGGGGGGGGRLGG